MDSVWFIDNTPGTCATSYTPLGESPWPVTYRALGENLGIAFAQNLGMREALLEGFDHVLLLDQDSLLPAYTVNKLLAAEARLLADGTLLAAVGPVFLDAKTGLPNRVHHHKWFRLHKAAVDRSATDPIETDWLIASSSLIRRETLEEVGMMREELFIDAVDMEWGMRAKSLGLRSFIVSDAPISHDIGESSGRFLGVVVIVHSSLRNYYIVRNWTYLFRVQTMGKRWRTGTIPYVIKFVLVHLWLSPQRWVQWKYFARAMRDGITGRMGRYAGPG